MPYTVQSGRNDTTLEYDVHDAATGAPMRITVLSGVIGLVTGPKRVRVSMPGQQDPGQPVSFYPPGATPVPAHPTPTGVVELSLTQLAIWDNAHLRVYGVGQAELHFAPDQQSPNLLWPFVTMLCFGDEPMGVRYRITLYRPKPT